MIKFLKQLFCRHKLRGLLVIEGRAFGKNTRYTNGCLKCNKIFDKKPFKVDSTIVKNKPEPAYFSFTEIGDPKKW